MMGNADEHDAQRRERLAKVRDGCDVAPLQLLQQLAWAGTDLSCRHQCLVVWGEMAPSRDRLAQGTPSEH
jgi:hypothetical protein